MKMDLKKNRKIVRIMLFTVLLFSIGIGIGNLFSSMEKEEVADWNIEDEVQAIGENDGLLAFKARIAYKDEIIQKKINQIEERTGELYMGAKDLSEITGADVQWNGISKQLIFKSDENYIIVDTERSRIIDSDGNESEIRLYGEEKQSLIPVGKAMSYFGFQISKLEDLGIFRIKTPDTELLDIELAQKYQAEFGVEIENYEEKYRVEKAILEEEYPEKKAPVEMKEIPDEKIAYLTFDDGPNENTEQLLDIMNDYGVKGTFFLLGNNIYGNEHILQRTYDEGHSIGLHSMNHTYKQVYASPDSFVAQMNECNELVKSAIGVKTKLIRPPYGSKPQLTEDFRTLSIEHGYRIWDWNIDSGDARGNTGAKGVYNYTISQASGFEGPVIILFHDKSNTVNALPSIIEYLSGRGYRFEAVTEDLLPFNFWKDKRYVD